MNLNRISHSPTLNLIVLFILTITTTSALASTTSTLKETKTIIEELRNHYKSTRSINTFSLKYHFLNKQYRDNNYWDYQTPNRVMSQRMVEVDLVKKHFYDNDILYYTGGRLYDRAQFQNDNESIFYEKSTSTFGKSIINKGLGNFDRFIYYMIMNVDFLAVRPLLDEDNILEKITFKQNSESNKITLTHLTSDDNIIDYEFNHKPLQLISINKKSEGAIYVYDDYQTSRGLTFARSLQSYYGGATEPAYIKFIDQFDIIEQVDPNKLRLPIGYGPELPKSDGVLVATEIATDLYLVTDSSARRNSLFKISGDNIAVFGASGYASIAKKTIELVNQQFPNKKITSVYVTHPHGHQIAGLKAYADIGAEILADEYSIAAIKAYSGFAGDFAKFKFRMIEHEQSIDGAVFYVLENLHAKRQSFVHFRSGGIIFQSDFLHIPFDNTIAKVIPNYTRTFIDFVRQKQLNIKRIIGNRNNNNISVEIMNKTYDALM